MRIGFDVDGVLAAFVPAYQKKCVEVGGRNLFHPQDIYDPPCWDWPQLRGYTDEEVGEVWRQIKEDGEFWLRLKSLPGVAALRAALSSFLKDAEIYFVTSRVGIDVKWQTEMWLLERFDVIPTVLISSAKGLCCHALKLDAYVDDNWDNIVAVSEQSPKTRAYLLDYAYNRINGTAVPSGVTRVSSLFEMLATERRLQCGSVSLV